MNEDNNGKQVIARAASVLFALENQQDGLTLAQLVRATELPRSTVHRLVAALEAQKLVINDASGIRLGPALTRLAKSVHKDIVTIARPFIEALGRKTRETIDLCVYRGQHMVSIDQYASDKELRVISAVGTAFPIHCSAHGKAVLAKFTNEKITTLLGTNLEKRTDKTITDINILLHHIHKARLNGFALDIEEHSNGVCGFGIHLDTSLNEYYAIAIAVPSIRFNKNFDLYYDSIIQCKAEIEAVMG